MESILKWRSSYEMTKFQTGISQVIKKMVNNIAAGKDGLSVGFSRENLGYCNKYTP